MATEFKDLTAEQIEVAAKMFWEIAQNFVYQAEPGMLVTFCSRCMTHGYASLSNLFNEQLIECSVKDLFDGIVDNFEPDFANLIKPLVLEKVQEELNIGEMK